MIVWSRGIRPGTTFVAERASVLAYIFNDMDDWTLLVAIAGGFTVLFGASVCVGKFLKSLSTVTADVISIAVDHSDTGKLVKYHLGPNGSTPPIHQRIRRLEEAHNIENTEVCDEDH